MRRLLLTALFVGVISALAGPSLASTGAPIIAAPFALETTNNTKTCAEYYGAPLFAGIACAAAIGDGDLVFIWKWQPNSCGKGKTCVSTIGGYRIYREGQSAMVKEVDDPQQFAAATSIKRSKSRGWCFYAIAFKGSQHSRPSNTYCSSGGASLATATLRPSNMLNTQAYKLVNPGACSPPTTGPIYRQDARATQQLVVGNDVQGSGAWCRVNYKLAYGRWWETSTYRGAVKFGLSKLAGKFAQKATLSFQVYASPDIGGVVSCADGIYFPNTDWTVGPHTEHVPVGDYFNRVRLNSSGFVTLDVTTRVNDWLSNRIRNDGFAMKGSMENLDQTHTKVCTAIYGSFRLTVNYFNT